MTTLTSRTVALPAKRRGSLARRRTNFYGYLFISPWLVGFFALFVGPSVASLIFSFADYNVLSAARFIGFGNYVRMFTQDDLFWPSLGRTFYMTGVAVPLGVIGSMILAILLNTQLKGVTFYRTLFFMPSLVPLLSAAVLWLWLLNADWGMVNLLLRKIGIADPPHWFGDRRWAVPSLIMMGLWGGIGGTRMIIFLAGLQGIPDELYDAAAIDGAGTWQKTRHVTLPLLTPTIFFNLVLGIIYTLQSFEASFVVTEGGPAYATWFFGLHIWKHAFDYWNMGYACALAWFFAVIIVAATVVQQRFSSRWVFYYGAE